MATPFMQYRNPVGCGPSENTWPRWPPQLLQWTEVRIMPNDTSRCSPTAFANGAQKLGHPVWLSNLVVR